MPQVTLTFILPDEKEEFNAHRLGPKALSTLWDIDNHCRGILKHGSPSGETAAILENIRRMIPEECLDV